MAGSSATLGGRLTTLDILKLLEGSNCGECGQRTCLAFAAQVFQGQCRLEQCPHLDARLAQELSGRLGDPGERDWTGEQLLRELRARFAEVDLAGRAELVGGWMRGERLVLRCLGKLFELDGTGGMHSDCHQNPWLHVPLLRYVRDAAGTRPGDDWVRFAELGYASNWVPYFRHRVLRPLGRLAGNDSELFCDIAGLFAERRRLAGFSHDESFLLRPLPLVPIVLGLRRAEEGLPAEVSVYCERSAERNLDAESLFRIGLGLAQMFERIARRHGRES